jgi:hypothetical protein
VVTDEAAEVTIGVTLDGQRGPGAVFGHLDVGGVSGCYGGLVISSDREPSSVVFATLPGSLCLLISALCGVRVTSLCLASRDHGDAGYPASVSKHFSDGR